MKSNYKPLPEHPKELTISTWWCGDYRGLLREALPHDHPENLYNWFRRQYPDLDPFYYGIEEPFERVYPEKK